MNTANTLQPPTYAYSDRWNDLTGAPIAEHRWLTEDEARAAYQAGTYFEIVRVAEHIGPNAVRAHWAAGFHRRLRIRLQWFNRAQSLVRTTDYDNIGGRLFRGLSRDYRYPDDRHRYLQFDSLAMVTVRYRPDGWMRIDHRDKVKKINRSAEKTGQPVDSLWMDFPAFGGWEQLGDINYGFHDLPPLGDWYDLP